MSKTLVNHEPAAEFALLRMAALLDVAVFSNFAPLAYPPHFLNGGDVSPAFYEVFASLAEAPTLLSVRIFQVHTRKS